VVRLLVAALACVSFLRAVDPEDHVRKSIPVSSATRLVLNVDTGAIRVEPGSEKSVEIEVYFRGAPSRREFDRMRRDFTLDVAEQGSDIRVTGASHKGWSPIWDIFEYGWLRKLEYRVTVPEKFNVDVETSGGPIDLTRLKGEVKAHTSGGPIRIMEVAGEVNATTSGGPISIERNLGRVRAHTSGGGIEIREATGAIDASTSGGGVDASLLGQPKEEFRLYTSGGSINLSLRKDIHADLDASTSGGRVWTDFPVLSSDDRHQGELRARLNGGGPRLYLHTSGGGITVRRSD
jgi:hypothetical protein